MADKFYSALSEITDELDRPGPVDSFSVSDDFNKSMYVDFVYIYAVIYQIYFFFIR